MLKSTGLLLFYYCVTAHMYQLTIHTQSYPKHKCELFWSNPIVYSVDFNWYILVLISHTVNYVNISSLPNVCVLNMTLLPIKSTNIYWQNILTHKSESQCYIPAWIITPQDDVFTSNIHLAIFTLYLTLSRRILYKRPPSFTAMRPMYETYQVLLGPLICQTCDLIFYLIYALFNRRRKRGVAP